MSAINIRKGEARADIVRIWFEKRHPEYPQNKLRVWEDGPVVPEQCNPYTDVYNVIYYWDSDWKCIRIKGMMIYGEWILKQFPLPIESPEDDFTAPLDPFVAPITSGNMQAHCTITELKERIDWILKKQVEENVTPLFVDDPTLEYVSRRVVGMIPWDDEGVEWTETCLRVERKAFFESMRVVTDAHVPLLKGVPSQRVDPTRRDLQKHYEIYPGDKVAPIHWFEVNANELSPETIRTLSIYNGYKVHIHYRQIADWQWCRYVNQERALRTHMSVSKKPPPIQLYELLEYAKTQTTASKKRNPGKRHKNGGTKKPTIVRDDVTDIEDLLPIAPPCVREMCDINRGRFPQHEERKMLVSIFQRGGIVIEIVEQVLDRLNEAYPHEEGPLDTRKRFDYIQYYDGGYGAPGCEKMSAHCPYKGSVDQRKVQCHKRFREQHPQKYKTWHADRFYGPVSWFYWSK